MNDALIYENPGVHGVKIFPNPRSLSYTFQTAAGVSSLHPRGQTHIITVLLFVDTNHLSKRGEFSREEK
uniref:Macaca fascicularis brain cDNA, clone: QtrA-17413 n=1 Tax=Macaca fascicularis TaxID=9541 RepID=I7GEV5_MACFA|nr:unnamed protein product [Macaca fascicularis]